LKKLSCKTLILKMLFVNIFLIVTSAQDREITGSEPVGEAWSWYQGRCTAEAPIADGKVVDPEGNPLPTDRTWGKEWIRPRDITPFGDQAAAFEQSKLSQGTKTEDACKQLCEAMTTDLANTNTCYAYEMRSGECFLITSDRVSWGGADGDQNAMCFRNNRLVAGWQSFNGECQVQGRVVLGDPQGLQTTLECKKRCNARADCLGFTSQGDINGNGLPGYNAPEDMAWRHWDNPNFDNRQNMLNPADKFVCALVTPDHDKFANGKTWRTAGGSQAGNGKRCYLRKKGCADYPGYTFGFHFSETEVGSLYNIASACECREQCKTEYPTSIAFTWWNARSEFKSWGERQGKPNWRALDGKNCQCWDKVAEAPVTRLGDKGGHSLGGGLGIQSKANAWSGFIHGSAPPAQTRPANPPPPAPTPVVPSPCSAPAPVSAFAGYRKLAGKGWCVQPDSSPNDGKIANYMRIGGEYPGPSTLSYAVCAAECDAEPLCHSFSMDCGDNCATSSAHDSAQTGNSHCEFYGSVAPLATNNWMPGTSTNIAATPTHTEDAYSAAGVDSAWRCWVKDTAAAPAPPAPPAQPVVTCGPGTELVGTECKVATPTYEGNCLGEEGGIEQGVVLEILGRQAPTDAWCRNFCNANPYCKMWMRTSKNDCYLYRSGSPKQEYISPSWHAVQRRGWKCAGADEPAPIGGAGCDGMTGRPDWFSGMSIRRGVHTSEECALTCQRRFDCKYWFRQKAGGNAPDVCWTASGASVNIDARQDESYRNTHIYGWKCHDGPPAVTGRRLERLSGLDASANDVELEAPPADLMDLTQLF